MMENVLSTKKPVFAGLILSVFFSQFCLAEDILNVRFTPTYAGSGGYGDRYVMAVWLTTTSGTRICTLGGTSQGGDVPSGKVALWAYTRYSSCYTWYNNNPTYRTDDRTDRTAATQNGYREYQIIWDWKQYNTASPDGTVIPDGTYELEFESSNDNGSANLNRMTVQITKGRTGWVLTPTDGDFINVRIEYIPSGLTVTNTGATNITGSSAQLNGEITDTGGEDPTVFVYWGQTDGGTTPGNWDHAVNLGVLGQGTFATNITDLTSGMTFYYRCRAINSTEDIWASSTDSFDAVNSYTIFQEGDAWKYFEGYSTPTDWNALGFSDSGWPSGPSGIGYGDGDDATELANMRYNYLTLYMRYPFTVDVPNEVSGLEFTVDYDDGFVAFINGQEVARRGVPEGQTKDSTSSLHEASAGSGGNPPEVIDLSAYASYLVEGENVFAIEVHNGSLDSSDLSMIPTFVMFGGMLPPQPDIQLSKGLLDFGTIDPGQTATDSFNIENTGTLPLDIQSLILTGLSKEAYTLLSPVSLPLAINPSEAQQVTVQYNPVDDGQHLYANLAVGSNDPDQAVVSIALSGQTSAQTAFNLSWVGGTPGTANTLAEYGNKILVGQGAFLVLMDVTDTQNPKKIGQIRMNDKIESIAVQADTAYVALGKTGIAVIDLTDFVPLTELPILDTPGHAYDVRCSNDYLCVADGVGGVRIYEIGSETLPPLLQTSNEGNLTRALELDGSKLVVLDEFNGLSFISLPNASVDVPDDIQVEFGTDVALADQKAFIVDQHNGLTIVDYASPTPAIISEMILTGGAGSSIVTSGTIAYITTPSGLEVVDITDAQNPSSLTVVPTNDLPRDLLVNGTNIAIADGSAGLTTMDAVSPTVLVSTGAYDLVSATSSLIANGGLESIISAEQETGAQLLNLFDSLNPQEIGTVNIAGDLSDLAIQNNILYAASGYNGLQLIDMSQTPPGLVGTYPTAGFSSDVDIEGDTAVVTDGDKVYLVDVTSANSPSELQQWDPAGWVHDVAINNENVFIATGGSGMEVYFIASGAQVGTYPASDAIYAVQVSGDTAYIADGFAGVSILDIADTENIAPVGSYDTQGLASDLELVGSKLCIGDGFGGITVLEISKPQSPSLYARSTIGSGAFDIHSTDSRVLVADQNGGLGVLGVIPAGRIISGDVNMDMEINLVDVTLLAQTWLEQETELDSSVGNLFYYDTIVNLRDLSVLASHWQEVTMP